MNEQIKQRITQLNNGEVPSGYKRTEIGVFPSDWRSAKLGQISKMCGGGTPDTKKYEYWRGDIPWISSSDLIEDKLFQAHISRYISKEAIINSATKLCPKNSIAVVTRVGLGKIALINVSFCTSQDFTNIIESSCDKRYLVYQIKNAINAKIRECQGTSIKGITVSDLQKVEINYPLNKEEQSKIAEILIKWDEAIELQEQYIQTLLSMKTTYVNKFFCVRDEEKTKFEILYKTAGEGGTPNTKKEIYYDSEDVPFVKIEHLTEKYITKIDSYISNLGLQKSGAWLVPENCLIFSNGATIGEASINKIPVATKQGILGIVPSSIIDVEYFYYLVKSRYFLSKVKKITTKGTMCTAYLKDINNLNIFLHEKKDQIKIAKFLSSIDCLVEGEKQKIDLLKEQRKTLQKYLLTGIVRV